MTEAEESARVAELAQSSRVGVSTVGNSVEGRPMRLLRIGTPPPAIDDRAVLLVVGGQHGIEPSGREACYALAEHLVDTSDSAELAFLAEHGLLLFPNANPDRLTFTRRNANDLDLNRQHVTLSADAPETRALADVLQRARPALIVDMHEAFPQSDDVTFVETQHPMATAATVGHGASLITAMKARATAETWDSGDYSTHHDERLLHNLAGLRHAAGVLVEVSQDSTSIAHRVAVATAMVEEALAYAVANADDLLSDADQSQADAVAAGEAGAAAFDLRTETIDPPPLGYRVTVAGMNALTAHLSLFGLQRSGPGGLQLAMGQSAYRVLPFLVDPGAEYATTSGVRLFALEADPPAPATVSELAPIVAGSHDPVVEARILTSLLTGLDPSGTAVDVLDGDVQFDSTAEAFASLSLTIPGVDPATGRSRYPRQLDDLLMPYGNEIFVRRGIDIGPQILWVPLGYFVIESVEQDDDPEAPITIGGRDRMGPLIDWEVPAPREFRGTLTVAAFLASLVGDMYPDATISFDDASGFETLGRTIVVDETRYEPMAEVVDGLGKVMHWDGEGILRIGDAPDADDTAEPVWQIRAGRNGVLIRASRRLSNLGAPNGVIVYGEGGTGDDDPVSGAAVDLGPKSPTRWGGGYGRRPIKETLPTVTTQAQAQAAAREKLRRHLGIPHSADFGTLVNPALRPRMPILVEHRDGSRDRHVVETLTVPLLPGGEMSGTTRERTHVVIGSQIEVV